MFEVVLEEKPWNLMTLAPSSQIFDEKNKNVLAAVPLKWNWSSCFETWLHYFEKINRTK